MSCKKAQEFLGKNNIEAAETVNAKQKKMGLEEALALTKDVDELFVSKGKKVIHVDLTTEKPAREELGKLLLGPTGNLRAPTARSERTLIVGFNSDMYAEVLA